VKKLIALVTFLAGLPGLAGIYLLFKLGNLPSGAVLIVVNAIVFRGVCGTLGGILLWTGRRIGSYLALVTWSYLVIVSVLTLLSLYEKGFQLSTAFRDDHLAAFGKPFAWSVAKLALGIPIFYILITDLLRAGKPAA
jgi:hypothetical protein